MDGRRSVPHARRASMSTAISTPALPPHRALPRQAMWFFVVSPPLLAFLFDPTCVKDPDHVVRALAAILAYTIIVGVGVHYGFEWLAAKMRGASGWLRLPAHGLLTTLIVAALTLPQLPLITWVYPEAASAGMTILWRGVLVSFVYLGLASFMGHLQREAVRERLVAHRERTAALEARLAALQAQMQPHFLFNSLNTCAGLVHADPDVAEETLDRLAGFLRYALESTERRSVSLDDELDAVRSYLDVQRQRFGDRLRCSVESDAEGSWPVPPMLLQPLVENAILHGLSKREQGGRVDVRVTDEDGRLHIEVEDDGVGPGCSTHSGTGMGQRNVRERLELLYGGRATLRCGPGAGGGYLCAITLPEAARG